MTEQLIQDLETMLDRWGDDADTLENAGMNRKSGQLKECHAELQHFVEKHRTTTETEGESDT